MIPKPFKLQLMIFGLYILLAILLTWPTVTQFTTHLPGDGGDDPAIAWNLWWLKYSILNEAQNPFFSDFMFYPLGINLAFYTLTVLNGLTTIPLVLNFGVVGASNLHLWFSFAVGGYGTFLLTRYLWAASPWGLARNGAAVTGGAILAGLMYTFASSKLFYVSLGQFNIASTHWLPFCVLFFVKMRHQPRNLATIGLCALFLLFQAWTEMTYASFLIVFMVIYWGYWALTDFGRRVMRWPYLRAGFLLVGLFVIGLAPILTAMLPDIAAEGDFLVEGGGFADIFSADVAGLFVPTVLHPWWGNLVEQTNILRLDPANPAIQQIYKGQHIYLGYTLLFLVGFAFYTHRRDAVVRFWMFSGLIFIWLMLGPSLIINGLNTGLHGPFVILQSLPFFKGNRYPSRYSVMVLLSLAPLAGLGFIYLVERFNPSKMRPKPLFVALCLLLPVSLFLGEHLATPLPQSDMRAPEVYDIIARDAEQAAVLDIPFAWRNGFRITGAFTTGFMFGQFYQTYHQKPMLQGNTSRNPALKFQYFTEAPILSTLRALETGHTLPLTDYAEMEKPYAAEVLHFFDIKYIVVRPETPGYLNTPQNTIPYIESALPVTKIYQNEGVILYQVVERPPWPNEVDLLTPSALKPLYFAEGWGLPGDNIIAQRRHVRLLVPLNGEAQTARFTLRLWPESDTILEWVSLAVNGWQSEERQVSHNWQQVTFDIPAEVVETGVNDIYLNFSQTFPLSPETVAVTAISAGEEAGNLGQIYVNGRNVSPGQRGYNVALISPMGALLAVANFDTHLDETASDALATFIAAAPVEAFLVVVAQDEASNLLTERAVLALQSLGSQVDLRGQFRASHAFIRTPTGEIKEAFDPFQPVKVAIGSGFTEPQVAVQFTQLQFVAQPRE